jgi:hypothetical protein
VAAPDTNIFRVRKRLRIPAFRKIDNTDGTDFHADTVTVAGDCVYMKYFLHLTPFLLSKFMISIMSFLRALRALRGNIGFFFISNHEGHEEHEDEKILLPAVPTNFPLALQ